MNADALVEEFLRRHGWDSLNTTQQRAIDAGLLRDRGNLIVIAPTGSGKTGVAELAIMDTLRSEPPGRAIYVAPLSALAKAKLQGFQDILPEAKVMALWKSRALSEAEVLVGINEFVYREFLKRPNMVRNFSLLILDELHIIYQPNRGHTVEKLLTLAKRMGLRIICLSATIEDKRELSRWLDAALVEVPDSERPIRLKPHDFRGANPIDAILDFDRSLFSCFGRREASPNPRPRNWRMLYSAAKDAILTFDMEKSEMRSPASALVSLILISFPRRGATTCSRVGKCHRALPSIRRWPHSRPRPPTR